MRTTALLALTALVACKVEDVNGPPPDPSDTITDTGNEGGDTVADATVDEGSGPMESATAADSTGDPADCSEEQWGHYTCLGWVAGMYTRTDGTQPTNYQFYFSSEPQPWQAECVTIPICRPFFGDETVTDDGEFAYAQCKAECDAEVANGEHPFPATVSSGSWTLRKTVCIFADNGNNGVVPNPTDGVTNTPGSYSGQCPWGPSVVGGGAPVVDTVIYEGCFDDDVCEDETGVSCSNWRPGNSITHSSSGTTHTSTITSALALSLLSGGSDLGMLYKCDDGFFTMYPGAGGSESWKMSAGMVSKDTLYKLGFRAGDYNFRVKKTGTSSWYDLDTLAHILVAFDALHPGTTSFTIEWRRPVGGSYATHTMTLSFV